jgi:23S rRNA (cytidine1920-2'-O)/16S rRNA (cytidine1409-2'-O)-methyltransferase
VRRRLDAELVRRGLARSRDHAAELIAAGRVRHDGLPAGKPATQVDPADALVVAEDPAEAGEDWVGRGARKLHGALEAFAAAGPAPLVAGRRCLDAGASTGGFTQVLLRRGAAHVVALDVGYGQLAWRLRTDPRVTVLERTNVRDATADLVGGAVELVVADLSFISLRLVLPALLRVATPDADLVLLVKPQFEAGREAVGRGGVVTDPEIRLGAVLGVVESAGELGLALHGVTPSPLPGPAGNVEYVVWLRSGAPPPDWRARVTAAVSGAAPPGVAPPGEAT